MGACNLVKWIKQHSHLVSEPSHTKMGSGILNGDAESPRNCCFLVRSDEPRLDPKTAPAQVEIVVQNPVVSA